MMENIVRLRGNGSTPTIGVGAYSEGTNDDLNKAVWSGIAANPNTTIEDLVAQYARYHFGADLEGPMTALLFGLEQNWVGGDIATNRHILDTLSVAASVIKQSNGTRLFQDSWRLQMYLYRAYYDAYVQARFQSETLLVRKAEDALVQANEWGSRTAIDRARQALALQSAPPDAATMILKQTCLELFNAMNASVGVEVIQGQVTSMNIDRIDEPTSDVGFLLGEMERFEQIGTETERVSAIHGLLTWEDPGVGGYYDNLSPRSSKGTLSGHLNPGQGPKADPAYYFSPLTTAEPAKPQNATRLSWQSSAMSFYDSPLILDYADLEPHASYLLEIVFVASIERPKGLAGERAGAGLVATKTIPQPVQLLANGQVLKDYFLPPTPMQKMTLQVPTSATATGKLRIECHGHKGLGGTGRTCNIAEVWLRRRTE
jgi:hypothetical protein